MKNKFTDIISSPMMNLGSIKRYSGTKIVEEEALDTHIVECQVMGYMIINYLNKFCSENLDKAKYLELALHHDLEESITGDVVRTLKYYNPSVLKELQLVASKVAKDMYKTYFYDTDETYYNLWASAKKEGKEGKILKLVDMLVVVNKVVKEVDLLHNYYFLRVAHEVSIYTQEFLDPTYYEEFNEESSLYLQGLILDAHGVIESILLKNEEYLGTYMIKEKSMVASN